ncbi:CLUMA_CG007856, isoform A, partial [Clunio marinus]
IRFNYKQTTSIESYRRTICYGTRARDCPIKLVFLVNRLSLKFAMENPWKSQEHSQKRESSPDSSSQSSKGKKNKAKYNNVTVNINQRIAKAFEEHLVSTTNESHREKCLMTLGAANGSEAGRKVAELLDNFKGKKQRIDDESSIEKSMKNSP